ncbi:MAG: hypothetical protein FWD35_05285 [Oscillospiraceae bacterium]|nr:hypothetical protein [Oscillospiraceae bacterium]
MTDDRRELLKLKQGLISEKESSLETNVKPHYEKPVGFSAVMANFYYHHKPHIFIIGFFMLATAGMLFLSYGSEKPDITVLLISDEPQISAFLHLEQDALQAIFEQHTPDITGNGNVFAELLFIDLATQGRSPQSIQASAVKLFGEIQGGRGVLIIGNGNALKRIPESAGLTSGEFYANLSDLFPECDYISDGFFLPMAEFLRGSDSAAFDTPIPQGLFLAMRGGPAIAEPLTETALSVIENVLLLRQAITD